MAVQIGPGKRGKAKDAYDLSYVLRHHAIGARAIGLRMSQLSWHPQIDEACAILRRDFTAAELIGPVRVAEFLGAPDDAMQADTAGYVRAMLSGAGVGRGLDQS